MQAERPTSTHSKHHPKAFRAILAVILVACFAVQSVSAQAAKTVPQTRLVVRDSLGLTGILNLCNLLGCSQTEAIGDPQGQLFMIQIPSALAPLLSLLNVSVLGLVSVEVDQTVQTQGATAGTAPAYLNDRTPFSYYGTTVWHGYVYQTGNQLIRTDATHTNFATAGSGVIVADIDTGVDPNHPVLKGSLLPGYDFTRNQSGGSEMSDVSQSTVAVLDSNETAKVSQSTVAVLDQSTVAVLDGPPYAAFGHGTMTAGIIHLVAPQAKIMPLKAFGADGSGYESNILRAIYYAVQNGAQVMNMSWDFTTYSNELATAVKYAQSKGVVAVASAGNDGEYEYVYPGALPGVINVASTSDQDIQSTFTNYGAPPVFMAAPGEGVMTLYPWGTYAAGWGTSFSTPFVAGAAALMLGNNGSCSPSQAASGLAHADIIFNPALGWGRLDTYSAVRACHGLF